MLNIGFKNTYFQGFPALKETHIQPNGQFWTVFGKNGQNGIFFKKAFVTFFSLLKALINCKVSEKVMKAFGEKCEKPPFLAFWAKLANFGNFWPKWAKRELFQQAVSRGLSTSNRFSHKEIVKIQT